MLKLRLKVGQATNKATGEKFPTFKTIRKDGKFMNLRFRKEVENVPVSDCFIFVANENCSIDKNRQYPVLWVHEIDHAEPLFQPNVQQETQKTAIAEFLDVEDDEDEE